MEQMQQQEMAAAAASKIPPPPPAQPPLPPPSSLEIFEQASESNNEIEIDDYEAFLQFKNSLKTSSKKPLPTSKTVIFKAYLTTTSSYSQEYSSSDEYPGMLEVVTLPFTTEKKVHKKISMPTKKTFSTTSTTTTFATSSKLTTSTGKSVNKKFKLFKTKTKPNISTILISSTTTTTSVTLTTPTTSLVINLLPFLEEKISEKLNYLSSNKLNSTQIFDEINEIKNLFNEHAKFKEINSTLPSTTMMTTSTTTTTAATTTTLTSTSTTSTTTKTSTSIKMTTSTTHTTQKPTNREEIHHNINNSDIDDDEDENENGSEEFAGAAAHG